MARQRFSSDSGVFGGKNSKLTEKGEVKAVEGGIGTAYGYGHKKSRGREVHRDRRFSWLFYVAAICLQIATESVVFHQSIRMNGYCQPGFGRLSGRA